MTRALLLLLVFAVPGCSIAQLPAAPPARTALSAPASLASAPNTQGWCPPAGVASREGLAPTCMQMNLGLGGTGKLVLASSLLLLAPLWLLKEVVLAPLTLLTRRGY